MEAMLLFPWLADEDLQVVDAGDADVLEAEHRCPGQIEGCGLRHRQDVGIRSRGRHLPEIRVGMSQLDVVLPGRIQRQRDLICTAVKRREQKRAENQDDGHVVGMISGADPCRKGQFRAGSGHRCSKSQRRVQLLALKGSRSILHLRRRGIACIFPLVAAIAQSIISRMARSPLTQHLARALCAFRTSRLTDRESHGRWQAASGTVIHPRRRFLGQAAALGAAAFGIGGLPGCASRTLAEGQSAGTAKTGSNTRGPITIIGGGIAGLTCAWRLRQAGVEADIYDAAARLGGRIITDRMTFADHQCELGGEFIDTDHATMLGLAVELGITLLDYQTDDKGLDDSVYHFGGHRLSSREVTAGFAPIAAAIEREHEALAHTDIDSAWKANPRAIELDRLSLAEWLDRVKAAGLIRSLLETAFTTEFGLDPQHSNVLNMLLMISADADRLALLGDSDERFHAIGGNDLFTTRLAQRIDSSRIHCGLALESVSATADGRYRLGFMRAGAASELITDHLVLALPFSILRHMKLDVDLPPTTQAAIAEMGYGTNTKLVTGYSSRPWREHGSTGAVYTDLPFQCCWDASRLQDWRGGMITSYAGGTRARALAEVPQKQAVAAFTGDLAQVFPGVAEAATGTSVRMAWHQQPFIQASYSSYLVGQYMKFAGKEGVAVGQLHFCGEHTSAEFQAYMEGGAQSGARVANEICAALGLPLGPGGRRADASGAPATDR